MNTKKVELYLYPSGCKCKLLIDGQEITNCRAVTVSAAVDGVTTVTMELVNVDVTVNGESEVETKIVEATDLSATYRYFAKVPVA